MNNISNINPTKSGPLHTSLKMLTMMDFNQAVVNNYENVGYTQKDSYNHCYREVKKKIENDNAQAVLDQMRDYREKQDFFTTLTSTRITI